MRLGVRLAILDREVEAGRLPASGSNETTAFLEEVEPHPEPVDGEELLSEINRVVRRFVVRDENQARAVALWAAFAHAHDVATYSPILAIESPEKRCGNTTLLSVISACRWLTSTTKMI